MSASVEARVEAAVRAKHEQGTVAFWVSLKLSETGSVQACADAFGLPAHVLRAWIEDNGYAVRRIRMAWLVKDGQRV